MVKQIVVDPEMLIKEDERLEQIFREKLIKSKNLEVNDKQFRNKIIDLLEIFAKSGDKNPKCTEIVL